MTRIIDLRTPEEVAGKPLGGPMGMLYQLQHELAGPYAVSQLGSVFEAILAASGDPVLFHCTIGREQ